MATNYHSGDKVLPTGTYTIVGPNGRPTKKDAYCKQGNRFPPTPKKDESFTQTINKTKSR